MKIPRYKSVQGFLCLFVLLVLIVFAGFNQFRTSASNNNRKTDKSPISVQLKSPNTPVINLHPGSDLPTVYESIDYSSNQLKGGQNQPLALASLDFDVDGFPDLITVYSSAEGGILTFHKGNSEAFAPHKEESFTLIQEGRFPDAFLKTAESFAIPSKPDFLATGDFDRDGNFDVVTATRGGEKIYFLSGRGKEDSFNMAQEIDLPGNVTAMIAGEIAASDNRADLIIGIENGAGASLLVFENAENGIFGAAANHRLNAPAISLELGKLDDDMFSDTAILTAEGVSILHGSSQSAKVKNNALRLEKINLPFTPQAFAVGDFIADRAGKMELALLGADGTVRTAKRSELDERPFSIREAQANRAAQFAQKHRGKVETKQELWQLAASESWTIDDNTNVSVSSARQTGGNIAPVLMKANMSGRNTDDILFLDSETREIKILSSPEPEKSGDEIISFGNGIRSIYTLEAKSQPMAMLSMKLNIFARSGLVVLQSGSVEPSLIVAAPTAIFTVDITTDTNAAAQQVCSAAGGDCSLRGAITKANGAAGADMIMLGSGTYTLTVANGAANEDLNATGDLDITQDLTIAGTGQANTIIQGGTTNANGIDKVFASNPFCTSIVNTSFSGITVRFGRNTQPNGAVDFSFTGGGMDWCNNGAGGTLTVTDSTFDNNNVLNGAGGGINLDANTSGGSVTLTGVTISNNSCRDSGVGITNPSGGGGLALRSGPFNLNMTNSTISNNVSNTRTGGGILFNHNVQAVSSFQLHAVTISGNSAFSLGGGILFDGSGNHDLTLDQKSIVNGNTSGTGASGTAAGGGLWLSALGTGSSAIVTQTTITNNVLSSNTADNRGGAGIFASSGSITISFSRIVNNTGTPVASGTGLRKDLNGGATIATNNWWGCSTGPSAAPCDTAVITAGSTGSLNFTPWIVLRHTASPSTITTSQTSTLTASFLTNSAGAALNLSDISVLIGLPITFNNPVKGTISNAQAIIQANGTATATFTPNAAGAGSADAIVDNDVAAAGRTNRATLVIIAPPTISKSFGAASILVGGSTSLSFTITNPAANTVSLTGISFTDTLPAGLVVANPNGISGTCGGGTITATAGSGTISLSGATLTINTNCTFSVNVTGTTAGVKNNSVTVNSTNGGTGNTATASITVIAPPDLTIAKTHVGNFSQGQPGAQYTITVTNSGGSSTSGTVTVVDTLPTGLTATAISGTGWACTLGTRTCTRGDALGVGLSYPAITLTVNVAPNAPASVTNTATVSGGGETNTTNNTANDVTSVLVVTSAPVEISGQVTTQAGQGLNNAQVTLTNRFGNRITVNTNESGYFRFTDIPSGETYIISVVLTNYYFATRVLNVTEDVSDLRIAAQ